MQRSRRVGVVAMSFLGLYAGVLLWHGPTNPVQLFPFSRWDLFSRVPPPDRTSYSVRLLDVGGTRLQHPVYFEAADRFVPRAHSPDAFQLLQNFGRAVERHDALKTAVLRHRLETGFLEQLAGARYQVVKRRFNLLDRFKCDCFQQETVLAEFEMRRR